NGNGNYVNVYAAPEPDLLPLQEASEGQKRKDRRGVEYMQTMLDASGTKEGERVETWGIVQAAPKPVNKGRDSPLQFFLAGTTEIGRETRQCCIFESWNCWGNIARQCFTLESIS